MSVYCGWFAATRILRLETTPSLNTLQDAA